MDCENRENLELNIGEHYQYRTQLYEVIAITGQRIQLRSVHQRKNICFQSYETLSYAHRLGLFNKIQEAPLLAEANKIIAGLSAKARERLNKRLAYVRGVLDKFKGYLPKEETEKLVIEIGAQIGDATPPHYTSIYLWTRTYLRANENPISLLSTRIVRKKYRIQRQPEEIQELVNYHIELLYHSDTPAPISHVIEAITYSAEDLNSKRANSSQLVIPSKSTLRRTIEELDTFETELHQLGRNSAIKNQRWSKKCRKLHRLLQRAECDTHYLDVIVVNIDGEVLGRPYLTVVLDVYSRRVIGWDISLNPPSIEKTIRAIKMSLSSEHERNGLATHYIVDNGSEFVAKKLSDCLALLGAEITFCEPGEPNQKPFVERWFKTLTVGLIHHIKGTTFSNIVERGDYDSEGEAIFTLEQIREKFKDWLDTVYHCDFHRGLNTSPDIYWDEHVTPAFPPKRYSQEDLRRIFLSMVFATPINGRIGFDNLQWTGSGVAYLSTLKHKEETLMLYYDPSELGTAWVCHPSSPDDIYSISAVDPYQIGLTMHMHNLVMSDLKEQEKKFDYSVARNNRVRINIESANAKGKRGRRKHAQLTEDGSLNAVEHMKARKSSKAPRPRAKLDPEKHLTKSVAPKVAQVVEVNS
ncbi:DDE-type integrase/transposase/recombinase [Metapseudomonas resinovorans]|uniref:DDE-type integrase/transposase/recombinase n=1 Tax=Metapseudomonas resinovorans TaxID=53412 RepID=UPI00041DB547|nr:DDE-type integrase/transposase/recombinase [Pseudomonas resinovorans]